MSLQLDRLRRADGVVGGAVDAFAGGEHRLRLGHRVERIERSEGGWSLSYRADGRLESESFPYVIIASGRYCEPRIPEIAGLETFSGAGGVTHAFYYRDPNQFRGQRVLVGGCGISAVEVAPEIAIAGAQRVVSCMRRQRYILPRIVAGRPIDSLLFNRYLALVNERLPLKVFGENLKALILRTSGTPQQWGAQKADDDPLVAGVTHAQLYLPLIAEGKIVSKPWIGSIAGQRVTFENNTAEEFDAILLATGFKISLPFLSPEIADIIDASGPALRLYRHTFHPQLPGLAFVGMFHQAGAYFPPLELQGRWITYAWAGLCRVPGEEEMAQEISLHQASEAPLRMNDVCIRFARAAGVEPDPEQWPELKRALLFGPLAPVSFRLSGPDALPDAAERLMAGAAELDGLASPRLTAAEDAQLRTLETDAVPG